MLHLKASSLITPLEVARVVKDIYQAQSRGVIVIVQEAGTTSVFAAKDLTLRGGQITDGKAPQ